MSAYPEPQIANPQRAPVVNLISSNLNTMQVLHQAGVSRRNALMSFLFPGLRIGSARANVQANV